MGGCLKVTLPSHSEAGFLLLSHRSSLRPLTSGQRQPSRDIVKGIARDNCYTSRGLVVRITTVLVPRPRVPIDASISSLVEVAPELLHVVPSWR